jgi:two-component system KDP operon response regulator KdpE
MFWPKSGTRETKVSSSRVHELPTRDLLKVSVEYLDTCAVVRARHHPIFSLGNWCSLGEVRSEGERPLRVAIIEDDPDTQEYITIYLESEGYEVVTSATGADGIAQIRRYDPDVVILDIQLPEMNGWDVCQQIRSFTNVPILMVSSVAQEEEDIIRGLGVGADDYLLKPLRPTILKARLTALLRRSVDVSWRKGRVAYVDERLMIDLHREEVVVDGQRVTLSFLDYQLLSLLVRNINHVVSSLDIIETLWSESIQDEYTQYARIYIGRLRKIIEPDPSNPRYIVTERGIGYRFVSQV